MSDNKTNIYTVKNILNSLSPKDLKATIEKSNIQITKAIEKLSNLFSKPREFATSGYSLSNSLIKSIARLKENTTVNSWIEELANLDSNFMLEEHYAIFNGSKYDNCNTIINQAIEIEEKFKNDYSEIIKDIQYHDITRQKLEHIIEINKDILKELKLLESINNQEIKIELKYLESLKEIINIEIAQLIYSSELCNSAINKIVNAFTEQKKFIDKTKLLIQNLKERLSGILNLISSNEDLSNLVLTNKELFKSIYQLNPEKIDEELIKLLPSNGEFENTMQVYTTHIDEITELSSSEENFYAIIKIVNDDLTGIRKIISDDEETSDIVREINLDFLKTKYTMDSERKIHELALESELLKDFFSELTDSEEDNDVEFF